MRVQVRCEAPHGGGCSDPIYRRREGLLQRNWRPSLGARSIRSVAEPRARQSGSAQLTDTNACLA